MRNTPYYEDHFDGPIIDSQPLATIKHNPSTAPSTSFRAWLRAGSAGERVEQVTPGGTKRYIMGQGQVMSEYNGSGSLIYNYIYANGKRIARKKGGNIDYYHNDMLGSARRMTSVSGWERDYYPFGQDRAATGSGNEYKFTGKEDDGHGLYYFGARYYDPELGRCPAFGGIITGFCA